LKIKLEKLLKEPHKGITDTVIDSTEVKIYGGGERMDKKNARGIEKGALEKSSHCGVLKISPNRYQCINRE